MSHMVYSDHIAITSGDKSTTTRSKHFSMSRPLSSHPSHAAWHGDTQRENQQFGKIIPPLPSAA